MFKEFGINSYSGPYIVKLDSSPNIIFNSYSQNQNFFFVVDTKVFDLYKNSFVFSLERTLLVEALESNKSFERINDYILFLLEKGIKRNCVLVAMGGGIIQDITCFISSILFRGLDWFFFPTTLLAQADSCIGSKSSINFQNFKNLIGTFYPPKEIHISSYFHQTLSYQEIYSGIGEIIKVFLIDSFDTFFSEASNIFSIFENKDAILHLIEKALKIKKRIIEIDEFDKDVRNIMNYGHTFGHAIESVTDFSVQHGIAVIIGMDMANFIATKLNLISIDLFQRIHLVFEKLLKVCLNQSLKISINNFWDSLAKDKKHHIGNFMFILPHEKNGIIKYVVHADKSLIIKQYCLDYFNQFTV